MFKIIYFYIYFFDDIKLFLKIYFDNGHIKETKKLKGIIHYFYLFYFNYNKYFIFYIIPYSLKQFKII